MLILEFEGVRRSKRVTGLDGVLGNGRESRGRVVLPQLMSRRVGQSARSGVFKGLDVAVEPCMFRDKDTVSVYRYPILGSLTVASVTGDSFKSFEMVGLSDARLEQVSPGGAIVLAPYVRTGPVYVHRLRAFQPVSLRARLIVEPYERTEETSAS